MIEKKEAFDLNNLTFEFTLSEGTEMEIVTKKIDSSDQNLIGAAMKVEMSSTLEKVNKSTDINQKNRFIEELKVKLFASKLVVEDKGTLKTTAGISDSDFQELLNAIIELSSQINQNINAGDTREKRDNDFRVQELTQRQQINRRDPPAQSTHSNTKSEWGNVYSFLTGKQ